MRALSAEFPSREISLNEYDVLFNLTRQPERRARLRDLNKHVLLTQPSVSRLIDRLVARGYVEKSEDPSDARGTLIAITDAGYALFRRVALTHMDTISQQVGGALNEDELRQLTALCDKLRHGIASS
ncbi:MarR family winged helix-turn-helix transcriptional regulator [Rathayibacter iranicus]|uniref:MarR family transcriptional regulator n=2 Tax=Rathayibacter iranicus TaxID=59737 RepID=A0AAD1EP50_9MICO|nr:MarR family winged helix-turn-helix transcriptional regulator [Rathayibacter iranicus]AZZ57525.1 MarR family transcriptional regulator [Rathayibacter iranicus]MWV29657.1 MarR family transcriptional regulator [Rathayibacter iranicus NCPPB 2253 = VKM Ac-1602]PPI41840.1 MarR family transcriptional regulator [Rathayibacter iranicus]PPI57744.1 MarR family transcriptional regulator [Rathayibacter iranicus]PPI68532.1 MarR family transcriptional regulator [Rathayibacter iranicus]